MVALNRAAAEALAQLPAGAVHACTDVTGFGLIGHATEMAKASGVVVAIDVAAVPLLDGALDLVERQHARAAGGPTWSTSAAGVETAAGLDPRRIQLLYDPQTSGGLLVAIAPDAAAGGGRGAVARRRDSSSRSAQWNRGRTSDNGRTSQAVAVTLR